MLVGYWFCSGGLFRPPLDTTAAAISGASRPWGNGACQKSSNWSTRGEDLSLWQFVLSGCAPFPGRVSGRLGGFWRLAAQFNSLSHVIEMSIADHPGVEITCDYRTHQHIKKLAERRPAAADYFDFIAIAHSDIRAAVLMVCEVQADSSRKEEEKNRAVNEKEAKARGGKGADKSGNVASEAALKGKQWPDGDWSSWKRKMHTGATAKGTDKPEDGRDGTNDENRGTSAKYVIRPASLSGSALL